jgi:thioredoxin-like negative regulator of GroEL
VELEDLLRSEDRLVLVQFWTVRCEPCRELRAQLQTLAGRQSHARIVAVDADREQHAVTRHGVRELPTLVFFKRGQELYRLKAGALPASTVRLLEPEQRSS